MSLLLVIELITKHFFCCNLVATLMTKLIIKWISARLFNEGNLSYMEGFLREILEGFYVKIFDGFFPT